MTNVIELDNLAVTFGGRPILKGLSIALGGRAIGLLGPNGAGKTTLIHTLLGFHKPASGTARVLGHDIRTDAIAMRAGVGYMPERDAFVAEMTAVHFVRLMAELSGIPSEAALERAHESLFYVGLGEARYRGLETYSLGMKQLAKLAQSIVHSPKLIILDEPTNGLDPPARRRMLDLVKQIRDSGHARILFSSHMLRDVEEVCEDVLILRDGLIAAYVNLEEDRKAHEGAIEIEATGNTEAFAQALTARGCRVSPSAPRRARVVLADGMMAADVFQIATTSSAQIRRLIPKRDSLEDIFHKAMENGRGSL